MYARILTASLMGLEADSTWVEVDAENGLPAFSVVGLANQPIKEAKERIHAAVINCGFAFPPKRITVNLTPANRKKEGSHYDLAIALGLLLATGQIGLAKEEPLACLGELTLDGRVASVDGVLSMIISLQNLGVEKVMLPKDNMAEASLVKGMTLIPVETLSQAADHLSGYAFTEEVRASGIFVSENTEDIPDFFDIKGQENVKRAAQLAAAGRHGMLMIGPPGIGKSMVGKRLPGIMPSLTYDEMLEVTKIYSVSGLLGPERPMITRRPYRAPHHGISASALIGGGPIPRPGEVSLAHKGVLFLDELPEFEARTLDMLRQPLEDKKVSVTRVHSKSVFPADMMLIAAMNPCRCGWFGDPVHMCTCTETMRKKYVGRISGPLLDRIDIHVVMERILYDELQGSGELKRLDSKTLREGVERAVAVQKERYKGTGIESNSALTPALMDKYCPLDKEGHQIMQAAFSNLNLSARAFHKALKVARTIADLDGSDAIAPDHLLEALSYRTPDKYFG